MFRKLVWGVSLFAFAATTLNAADKPNVLLIFTDDHRYSGVGILGGQPVKTPHLDQLASEGKIFTDTYLMGSFTGATCIASRAQLLSGRDLFNLRGGGATIPEEHTTIGEAFQRAGYHAHHVGKWHQDRGSLKRSFNDGDTIMGTGGYLTDHFRMPYLDWDPSGAFSPENAYLLTYNAEGKITKRPVSKDDKRGPTGTEKDGPHSSEVFADKASAFIRNRKQGDPPFFMYLAFHAPHDPHHSPQEYLDMYPTESMSLPPAYQLQHPFDNGHLSIRDERLAPWPRTPEVAKNYLAHYYAIITHLDAQIGRVIEALKQSGQYDNTIIAVSGDSGLAVGSWGLTGKQNLYNEGGIHVPIIFSGKITGKGERLDALTYIHDIYPTLTELAGIQTPESVGGRSFAGVVQGKSKSFREYTYHAYRQHQRAYRKGDYKLIEYVRAPDSIRQGQVKFVSGSRVTHLFNIKTDPWETTNLSFQTKYQELLASMKSGMKEAAETYEKKRVPSFWDYYQE